MTEKIDMPNNIEKRILAVEDIELRIAEGDKPKIIGYAAKYNKWSSDLGGFREKIKDGAFDSALNGDIRALKNHDPNLILGRTKSGTLRLNSDSVGLRFEIDPPNTNTGRDIVEEIRRGDISGCSFSFVIAEKNGDEWKYNKDNTVERTLNKIVKLDDISPCTYPAYPDTAVAIRSLKEHRPEPDVTENYIRLRQRDPADFREDTFRTISISEDEGIKAVAGKLKNPPEGQEDSMVVQSYLFDKDKWTIEKAQNWVKEHKNLDINKIEKENEKIERERRREIERKYRLAGRIILRNRKDE